MQALTYFLALPFLYLISILPFPILYLISDGCYFLIYHVIGYRKSIVLNNLRNSFPDRSEKEIRSVSRKYYRYLCDLTLETFKTLTISRKSMLRHCRLSPETIELFNRYHREEKSVIIVMGHYGNWEWAGNSFSLSCKQQLYVVYHPLHNKWFNGLIYRMRTRFGTRLYAMSDTFREMVKNRKEISATAFIADQTPHPENAHWMTFLRQDTPVFRGTEKISSKLGYPIVYVKVDRLKRGYYYISAETLMEKPTDSPDGEISELHTRRLEQDIITKPEIWLWSHRRWKHQRPSSAN